MDKKILEQVKTSTEAGVRLAFAAYQKMGEPGIIALSDAFQSGRSNIISRTNAVALYESAPRKLALEVRKTRR